MLTETDARTVIDVRNDEHVVMAVARETEEAMSELGYDVDLLGALRAKPGTEAAERGLGLTLQMSETVQEATENGFGWLSINEDLAGHFGRSRGSSNVTHIAVDEELTARETIHAIAEATYDGEADNIKKGLHLLELMRKSSDPSAELLMAYNLFLKALGWYAERALAERDDFKKGSASHDTGGIDLFWDGEPKQLKTVTRAASQGIGKFEEKDVDHIFYGWTADGLILGEEADIRGTDEVTGKLKSEAGLRSKTILKVSHNAGELKDYPRPARVFWW